MALDLPQDDDDARPINEALLRPIRYPPKPATPTMLRQVLRDYALTRDAAAAVMDVALISVVRYLRPESSNQNRKIPRLRFEALLLHVQRMREQQEAGAAAAFVAPAVGITTSEPPAPVVASVAAPAVLDDRRCCNDCGGRKPLGGLCVPARRGLMVGRSRNYVPVPDVPHRCPQYLAGRDDFDRRPGSERWPAGATQ
jgi:hypothetical protein